MRLRTFVLTVAIGLTVLAPGARAQEKIRVGYWTSGFSVGFGAVLEAGKFLEQAGLQPEWIRFSDVNGRPEQVDAAGELDLTASGQPVRPAPPIERHRFDEAALLETTKCAIESPRSQSPPRETRNIEEHRMAVLRTSCQAHEQEELWISGGIRHAMSSYYVRRSM